MKREPSSQAFRTKRLLSIKLIGNSTDNAGDAKIVDTTHTSGAPVAHD